MIIHQIYIDVNEFSVLITRLLQVLVDVVVITARHFVNS